MKATRKLHDISQSLWLDNITRNMLNDGTLNEYLRKPALDLSDIVRQPRVVITEASW